LEQQHLCQHPGGNFKK